MDLQGCNLAGKVEVIQHIRFSGKFQSEGGGDQQRFITVYYNSILAMNKFQDWEQYTTLLQYHLSQ